MRGWIAKRPILSFYLLTLGLSWGYWLTLLALGQHVGAGSVAHFPGLLGPLLAALTVTALTDGRRGLQELGGRMWRLGPRWGANLLLALSPLALGVAAFAMLAGTGQSLPPFGSLLRVPGMPEAWPMLAVVAAVIVVNGLGEETGWRGFLTERFVPRHGRVKAALWVGLLWAFWHLPLFWLNDGMAALLGPVFFGWLFALLCGAFVLAQVYLVTGHSILCVALWHVGFNMMVFTGSGSDVLASIVSTAVMVWGVMVAARWWRGARTLAARP